MPVHTHAAYLKFQPGGYISEMPGYKNQAVAYIYHFPASSVSREKQLRGVYVLSSSQQTPACSVQFSFSSYTKAMFLLGLPMCSPLRLSEVVSVPERNKR